ncbi:MAG: hypothetical protein LN416_08960 [Candidatus Thermoplasmatota archaeon]|nr:hypothetical protein [Candidatus Thermoplasmatota archaeon]
MKESSMRSDTHRLSPIMIEETPATRRRKLGGWALLLGILALALSFCIMPGSRSILADLVEFLGFSLSMLGLAIVLVAVFLVSRREEIVT